MTNALLLEEVFRTEGVPEFTFVQPPNYNEILLDIRRAGKPVILEGQSGTGKTTAVRRIIEELRLQASQRDQEWQAAVQELQAAQADLQAERERLIEELQSKNRKIHELEAEAAAALIPSEETEPSTSVRMGGVAAAHAKPGTQVNLMVRGKPLPARIVEVPFVPNRYVRKV